MRLTGGGLVTTQQLILCQNSLIPGICQFNSLPVLEPYWQWTMQLKTRASLGIDGVLLNQEPSRISLTPRAVSKADSAAVCPNLQRFCSRSSPLQPAFPFLQNFHSSGRDLSRQNKFHRLMA